MKKCASVSETFVFHCIATAFQQERRTLPTFEFNSSGTVITSAVLISKSMIFVSASYPTWK